MKGEYSTIAKVLSETGTHKPQVTGSSPVAATNTSRKPLKEQGLVHNPQAYSHINPEQGIPLKQIVCGLMLHRLLGVFM